MRFRVLGCGDAFGSGGRFNTCFHVAAEHACFLINCGASSLIAIRRFGVDPNAIETVFLTPPHGDHFAGLPWLILDGQILSERTRPLRIVGPRGTRERLFQAMEVLFPGSSQAERRFAVEVTEIEAGVPATFGAACVLAFAMRHPSGAPSLALRLTCGNKTVGYTGDTEWVEAIVEAGCGADLLIAEGCTLSRAVPFHLDWATLKSRLPDIAPKWLMLTHMSAETIAHAPDGYIAAEDVLTIEL